MKQKRLCCYLDKLLNALNPKQKTLTLVKNVINKCNKECLPKLLASQENPSKKEKPPQLNKFYVDHKDPREIHKEMVNGAQELTKKLMKEQNKRFQRLQEWQDVQALRILEEDDRKEREKESDEMKRIELKESRLKDIINKSEQRKKSLDQLKSEIRPLIVPKPLFKKLNEEFLQKVQAAEVEKMKSALERKRMLFKPLNHEELAEHEKNHEELLRNLRRSKTLDKTQSPIASNPNLKEFIVKERNNKIKHIADLNEKRNLLDLRRKYGQLVQQVYSPSIDPFKKQELELIRERILNPVPKKIFTNTPSTRSISVTRSARSKFMQDKTPNTDRSPNESQMNEKREKNTSFHYLEDFRKRKADLAHQMLLKNFSSDGSSVNLKKLEHLSKQLSPLDPRSIETEERISELLLENVKKKLSMLI